MKNFKILTLGCAALLVGCQQASEMEQIDEELLVSIEATINDSGSRVDSRYSSSDGTPNNLVFDEGNSIGLFMEGKELVQWTKTRTGWDSANNLYWTNKTTPYDFYAFYPYAEVSSIESVPMPSLEGQKGTVEGLSDCDFLAAYTNQNYGTDGTVSFTGPDASFKHVSSLVAVTIKGNCDLAASVIKSISFSADDIASGTTYSFTTKTTSFIDGKEVDEMKSSDLNFQMVGEDKTFYFILNSGISLSDITFCLRYSTDGVSYKAEKIGLGSGELTSGGRYNFNLSISDGVLIVSGGEIQNWGDGTQMDDVEINTPTVDEESGDENA